MRKLALIALATFTTSVFAVSGLTQPRRPTTRRPPAAARAQEVPLSDRIAGELGAIHWGMNHEQV